MAGIIIWEKIMNKSDRPIITSELVYRFAAYHKKFSSWGALHIVLDDNNLSDSSVDFCIDAAKKIDDKEGEVLAHILRSLTKSQRYRIGRKAEMVNNEHMDTR